MVDRYSYYTVHHQPNKLFSLHAKNSVVVGLRHLLQPIYTPNRCASETCILIVTPSRQCNSLNRNQHHQDRLASHTSCRLARCGRSLCRRPLSITMLVIHTIPCVSISAVLKPRRGIYNCSPALVLILTAGRRSMSSLTSNPLSRSCRRGSATPAPGWYTHSSSYCGRSTCRPLGSCSCARPNVAVSFFLSLLSLTCARKPTQSSLR